MPEMPTSNLILANMPTICRQYASSVFSHDWYADDMPEEPRLSEKEFQLGQEMTWHVELLPWSIIQKSMEGELYEEVWGKWSEMHLWATLYLSRRTDVQTTPRDNHIKLTKITHNRHITYLSVSSVMNPEREKLSQSNWWIYLDNR